jgi:hypothetical protein
MSSYIMSMTLLLLPLHRCMFMAKVVVAGDAYAQISQA